jgi:hypothetical protein
MRVSLLVYCCLTENKTQYIVLIHNRMHSLKITRFLEDRAHTKCNKTKNYMAPTTTWNQPFFMCNKWPPTPPTICSLVLEIYIIINMQYLKMLTSVFLNFTLYIAFAWPIHTFYIDLFLSLLQLHCCYTFYTYLVFHFTTSSHFIYGKQFNKDRPMYRISRKQIRIVLQCLKMASTARTSSQLNILWHVVHF